MTLANSGRQRPATIGACLVAVWLLASCAAPEQTTQANERRCASYGLERRAPDFFSCITGQDLDPGENVYPPQTYLY